MQLVVVSAVRKAVSAATTIFTAISISLCYLLTLPVTCCNLFVFFFSKRAVFPESFRNFGFAELFCTQKSSNKFGFSFVFFVTLHYDCMKEEVRRKET
jgi:hypothetical protein